MMELYNKVCRECSKHITNRYSTSFSMGIRVFDKRFRSPIYAVYGFVRFADEIVDTFHEFPKKALLDRFREDTYRAIEERISLNPVLHAFQETVHQYQIERELIDAFLDSMEMDLHFDRYHDSLYKKYIYGSAEVVGLMCLRVFVEGDNEQYERLKAPACSLGSAFQKINFLRDMKSDFDERGRVYFPGVDYTRFCQQDKLEIEADIKKDFDDAYKGIVQLPEGARFGVYLAYIYYTNLFKKIRSAPADRVTQERIRVPNRRKAVLLFSSALRNSLNLL
ncbi:phytoene/squalene synthase family protein [Phaeodactylibacter sp.]|mgnify:FL=1|jgi:phytoene/squalene synthetase|uniref:phytoene/squalene synthase family protein n=1 Tax=Phaeodactylibacter sp. TaxID=1940289 RepID=UPI0025DF71BD|nr:phytoene/squalene synthase family protein [Phaeodactylibacter sp.]MCI4646791.1 phytoene/squalene synthase family protein [Phaeodactylibacter sp.]MCI5091734.1 phytoene/squalene synthase family protein [Phaeodactylibacter sp.]